MRILLIDFNYENLNRTVQTWKLAWMNAGEVTLFGPGYVSDDEWAAGVKAYVKAHGPFEVVVASELLSSALNTEVSQPTRENVISRGYRTHFAVRPALDGCQRNYDEWLDLNAIRILSMLEFDAYNMRESHSARLTQAPHFVVGWGKEFVRPKAEIPLLDHERFGGSVNDLWYQFVSEHPERIISSPAMVSEDEFFWGTWQTRAHEWTVQGARYVHRERMKKELRAEGVRYRGRLQPHILALGARVDRSFLARGRNLANLQYSWSGRFRSSKVGFTCGSALGFPLRKYLEIPASGALLCASPCNGMEALGFEDGVNYLDCGSRGVAQVRSWLKEHMQRASQVARAGQTLVWEKHRVVSRGRQYRAAVNSIASGTFNGSRWRSGAFEIEESRA